MRVSLHSPTPRLLTARNHQRSRAPATLLSDTDCPSAAAEDDSYEGMFILYSVKTPMTSSQERHLGLLATVENPPYGQVPKKLSQEGSFAVRVRGTVCVGRHPENDSPFVQTAGDPADCDLLSACGTRAWRNLGNVLQIGAFVEMGLIRRVLLSVDQFGTSTISCMWPSSAL